MQRDLQPEDEFALGQQPAGLPVPSRPQQLETALLARWKILYIRQDEALVQLGNLGQVHGLGSANDVAQRVRSHDLVLLCDFGGLSRNASAMAT